MKVEDMMDHEIAEIRKGFDKLDFDKNNTIKTADLGNALRWLKLVPSEAQIEDFKDMADPNKKGRLKFSAFLEVVDVFLF